MTRREREQARLEAERAAAEQDERERREETNADLQAALAVQAAAHLTLRRQWLAGGLRACTIERLKVRTGELRGNRTVKELLAALPTAPLETCNAIDEALAEVVP